MSIDMNEISVADKLHGYDCIVLGGVTLGLSCNNARVLAYECYTEAFGKDHTNALNALLSVREVQGKVPDYEALSKTTSIPTSGDAYQVIWHMWETTTWKKAEAQSKAAKAASPTPAKGPAPVTVAVDPAYKLALNTILSQATSGQVSDIESVLTNVSTMAGRVAALETELLDTQRRMAAMPVVTAVSVTASGAIPNGKSIQVSAKDIFVGPGGKKSKMLDFQVYAMEWDAPHPHVPAIDPDYVFQPAKLATLLWAIQGNKMPWVHGHTGSGKTTAVENICARLGLPFYRVNMDSEIGRLDLIGRETLVTDPASGNTISKFVEGILPQAMQGPGILCADEVDFIRPDVAYVMQRFLEDKGLMLTEDGGRLVTRHPLFRYVATANTRGQGDEYGVYQGARPQSAAFLDRHRVFVEIDYLKQPEEAILVKAKVPGIDATVADQLANLAVEIRQSFKNGEIMQVITPRGLVAMAEAFVFFSNVAPNRSAAMGLALDSTILGKATEQDAAVIRGLVNRVVSV